MIDEIEEYWEDADQPVSAPSSDTREQPTTNEVFIVHGTDEGVRRSSSPRLTPRPFAATRGYLFSPHQGVEQSKSPEVVPPRGIMQIMSSRLEKTLAGTILPTRSMSSSDI